MTEPREPRTTALLLEGLEACFATAGGNRQTPRVIADFLRVAYLPAIEDEALRAAAERVRALPESRHVLGYPEGKRWVRKSEVLAAILDGAPEAAGGTDR